MEFMNIFQWPRQILQYTIDTWKTSGGPSGQDLYQDCNDVIRGFERAFALENGWAVHDKEMTFHLQEAALGLKQWKDSIRWCATLDHHCFSEEDNESLVQLVLVSLEKENFGLSETISQHMRNVAKALNSIEQLYIQRGRSANRSGDRIKANNLMKDNCIKLLDTSLECLAIQLVPLSTYAELVFQPSHPIAFRPIPPSNTLQAMKAQESSSKPKDKQAPAFLRSPSDPMPSSQCDRAETPQEVAITQDLAPASNPQVEAKSERVAVLQETSGLHILFEPTTASSDLGIDIIAVHGPGGDGFSTWTDGKSGKLWLRDLLPRFQGFRNARVMTFNYVHPTSLSRRGTRSRTELWLDETAESLESCIMKTRDETNTPRGKPIMFIGHSLGGIIIKMALAMAHGNDARSIFYSTKSIIFFGTPRIGRQQKVAERLLTLQRIIEAAGIKQDEALEASRYDGNLMVDTTEWFHDLGRGLLVTSFYEREKYNDVLVVDGNQARGNFANETTIGLDANHHTICQFASEKDEGFAEVHRAMYMHLMEISRALDAKEHSPTENKRAILDDLEATTKPL